MIKHIQNTWYKRRWDIRWWMLLYVVLHLVFIVQPPIESVHAWRQCLTNMIARNLSNGVGNLFYPHIDYGGASQGIMASEFPVLQHLIALSHQGLGFNHWVGRLVNLVVTSLGMMAFYLTSARLINRRAAFFGTIALMISIWLMFARKSMPDTFAVSLVLMGLYMVITYLDGKSLLHGIWGIALIGLGILAKLPALLVLTPLGVVMFNKHWRLSRKLVLFTGIGLVLIPVYWWYYKWVPHLVALDNNPLFFPRSLGAGWQEIRQYPYDMWQQFTFRAFFSYMGFGLFCVGVVYALVKRNGPMMAWFGVSLPIVALFVLKTGLTFPIHSYYMVPIVPIMAVFVGYGLAHIPSKVLYIVLPLFVLESLANQHDQFMVNRSNLHLLEFEAVADEFTKTDAQIACNGGPNPQLIYFLNRKGWSLTQDQLTSDTLTSLKQNHQVDYLFHWNKYDTDTMPYEPAYRTDHLTVYKLP